MNNELMSKAITGIDEDLIADAHAQAIPRRTNRRWISLASVAACLVLVFALGIITRGGGGTQVYVEGALLSGRAIALNIPNQASPDSKQPVFDIITVPVDITVENAMIIEVFDGTIEVFSDATGELLGSGKSFCAEESVSVRWLIDAPDTTLVYEMDINNSETVLLLKYDENLNNWTIKKQ